MKSLLHRVAPGRLLARLIDSPDLVHAVRALDQEVFSALVRKIGLEDAGEIVALATTEQLVAAFDEDLFSNTRPGEREVFNSERFVIWLEVLLEAGEEVAAGRFAELSEEFVVQALSSIVLVLDHDALLASMSQGGEDAAYADKALESCLSEELDGYLLISRSVGGWDAALSLVLALDRDHRAFLVRILDRCADMASGYIDDLDKLATVLSAEDSLAEDVEAEREERRAGRGYVEPRAARSFLSLARMPLPTNARTVERDPVTLAYFRDVLKSTSPAVTDAARASAPRLRGLLSGVTGIIDPAPPAPAAPASDKTLLSERQLPLIGAMQYLSDSQPRTFSQRMEEIAYLANVLIAGAGTEYERFRSAEAAEAVLATVAFGAELVAQELRPADQRSSDARAAPAELCHVLETYSADLLFRKASSALVHEAGAASLGFLRSRDELEQISRKNPSRSRTLQTKKSQKGA